jgi:hypothetical protein
MKTINTILAIGILIGLALIAENYICAEQNYWFDKGKEAQRIENEEIINDLKKQVKRLEKDNWNMKQAKVNRKVK